jgi:hypothetical protein
MVKKVSASKKAVTEQAAAVEEEQKKEKAAVEQPKDSIEEEKDVELNGDESQTVKQKKENARKMLSAVKKFNAKLKSSLERK